MRSWQDWFPDGEAISSLVPLPCPCPNSGKEEGQNKFDKELGKQIVKINKNEFSLRYFFQKLLGYKKNPHNYFSGFGLKTCHHTTEI